MPDFVTLSCPGCGAKLNVAADIDRGACSYCGQEHVVRRSGGIVTLVPVALNGVHDGADRAAAEPTIARLQREIAGLADQREQYLRANPRPDTEAHQTVMIVLGILAILVSFLLFVEGTRCACPTLAVGIILLAIGLIPILQRPAAQREWERLAGEKLKAFAAEIAEKEEKLKQARETAASGKDKARRRQPAERNGTGEGQERQAAIVCHDHIRTDKHQRRRQGWTIRRMNLKGRGSRRRSPLRPRCVA